MSKGAEKHQRGSPTGATPQQREKRSMLSEGTTKKRLSFTAGARGSDSWSALEERSLVEFVMKEGFVKDWPNTKKIDFWEGAAKFIEEHD